MAVVDTLGIADELARDGVFSREQAERLARISGRAATDALTTKSDLETFAASIRGEMALLRETVEARTELLRRDLDANAALFRRDLDASTALFRSDLNASVALLRSESEARLQATAKELVKWFAGILLAHGIAVIGVTVTLVKLL